MPASRTRGRVAALPWGRVAAVICAALSSACTTDDYSADADRDVSGILGEYHEKALAGRPSQVQLPKVIEPAPEESAAPGVDGAQEGATPDVAAAAAAVAKLKLDLVSSLATAMKSSRKYQLQREALYLSGLGFTLTKFNYGPKFSAAVNALWGKSEGSARTDSYGGSFGVSQLLPTNGQISLSSGLTRAVTIGQTAGVDDWSSNVGVSLTQPLLRNAGFDQYRESLTQGERSMVYAVRDFELFREQFVIDIAQEYFSLVSRKKQLVNQEVQLDNARFDEEKTKALHEVDRAKESDVIQTRRARISAEQFVLNARTDYRRQVEHYLVDLGLDSKTPAEIIEDEPPFEAVSLDAESIVAAAFNNRLDLQNEREQIEDQERRFRLQRQDFLPDLSLVANTGVTGAGTSLAHVGPDQWSRSAGLSLSLPLQQINERNAWRTAEIALDQSRRNWAQQLDDVRTGVQAELRSLKNLEQQIELDKQSIKDEQNNVDRLFIQQESGEVSARDLVESRQNLVNSQNRLIDDQASHFIARLGFYKDIGLLFVDDVGRWNIGSPVPEDRK